MEKIYDNNGRKVGSIEKSNDGLTVRDEYGWKQGSVKKSNYSNDYVVRDKYGIREGKLEKQFLSDDYTIKDSLGNKVGTVEKGVWSERKRVVKDNSGRVKGTFNMPAGAAGGGMSTAAFFAIIIIGGLIYLSIGSIPEHLSCMFIVGEDEFYAITVPVIVDVAAFFIALISGSLSKASDNSFMMTMFVELMMGMIIFAVTDAIVFLLAFFIEHQFSFLEVLVGYIGTMIMYLTTYLVFLVPGSLVGAVLVLASGDHFVDNTKTTNDAGLERKRKKYVIAGICCALLASGVWFVCSNMDQLRSTVGTSSAYASSDYEDDFYLPESSERFYSDDEIKSLDLDETQWAINEIYARHGRIFRDEPYGSFFANCEWFEPLYSADEFDDSVFNKFEKHNINLLASHRSTLQ